MIHVEYVRVNGTGCSGGWVVGGWLSEGAPGRGREGRLEILGSLMMDYMGIGGGSDCAGRAECGGSLACIRGVVRHARADRVPRRTCGGLGVTVAGGVGGEEAGLSHVVCDGEAATACAALFSEWRWLGGTGLLR